MKSLSLHKPHLLIVVGIPGSGKTFFAQQFADTFNAPFVHYDTIQNTTEHPLTPEDTARFAGVLFDELTKTKQTILIEGPGARRNERAQLAARATAVGYEPLFIWVQTEPTAAQQRASKGGMPANEFEDAMQHFAPLTKTEKSIVISGKHTYASQARIVLKRLVQPELSTRAAPSAPPERPTRGRINVQ